MPGNDKIMDELLKVALEDEAPPVRLPAPLPQLPKSAPEQVNSQHPPLQSDDILRELLSVANGPNQEVQTMHTRDKTPVQALQNVPNTISPATGTATLEKEVGLFTRSGLKETKQLKRPSGRPPASLSKPSPLEQDVLLVSQKSQNGIGHRQSEPSCLRPVPYRGTSASGIGHSVGAPSDSLRRNLGIPQASIAPVTATVVKPILVKKQTAPSSKETVTKQKQVVRKTAKNATAKLVPAALRRLDSPANNAEPKNNPTRNVETKTCSAVAENVPGIRVGVTRLERTGEVGSQIVPGRGAGGTSADHGVQSAQGQVSHAMVSKQPQQRELVRDSSLREIRRNALQAAISAEFGTLMKLLGKDPRRELIGKELRQKIVSYWNQFLVAGVTREALIEVVSTAFQKRSPESSQINFLETIRARAKQSEEAILKRTSDAGGNIDGGRSIVSRRKVSSVRKVTPVQVGNVKPGGRMGTAPTSRASIVSTGEKAERTQQGQPNLAVGTNAMRNGSAILAPAVLRKRKPNATVRASPTPTKKKKGGNSKAAEMVTEASNDKKVVQPNAAPKRPLRVGKGSTAPFSLAKNAEDLLDATKVINVDSERDILTAATMRDRAAQSEQPPVISKFDAVVDKQKLECKMNRLGEKYGLMQNVSSDVVDMMCHAVRERLANVLEDVKDCANVRRGHVRTYGLRLEKYGPNLSEVLKREQDEEEKKLREAAEKRAVDKRALGSQETFQGDTLMDMHDMRSRHDRRIERDSHVGHKNVSEKPPPPLPPREALPISTGPQKTVQGAKEGRETDELDTSSTVSAIAEASAIGKEVENQEERMDIDTSDSDEAKTEAALTVSNNITLEDCLYLFENDRRTRKGTLLYKWYARLGDVARR